MQKSTSTAISNAENNIHQGNARKVLCVCTVGLLRSPTIANALHVQLGYNTRSCGVDNEYSLIPINEALLAWADEVVFANQDCYRKVQKEIIARNYKDKCIILSISDDYDYGDERLVSLALAQYRTAATIQNDNSSFSF